MKLNQSCVNETISSMLSDKISALFLQKTYMWHLSDVVHLG